MAEQSPSIDFTATAARGNNFFTVSLKIFDSWVGRVIAGGLTVLLVSNSNTVMQALKMALEVGQGLQVGNVTGGSLIVKLHCNTRESLLSFMEDFKTKKVKRRLEQEFQKAGFEVELEVTITNEKEVYEELDKTRLEMEDFSIDELRALITETTASQGEGGLVALDLAGKELYKVPDAVTKLHELEVLWLHDNNLTSLPAEISSLKNLKVLVVSNNELEELPTSMLRLRKLKSLNMDDNKLTKLPDTIGDMRSLQTLSLTGNKLTELPTSIRKLHHLNDLYLDHNMFTMLPAEICDLEELSWLDVKGNDLTPRAKTMLTILRDKKKGKIVVNMEVPFRPTTEEGYKMTARPRGVAMIINNKTFDDKHSQRVEAKTRNGSEIDVEKLQRLFKDLHFKVRTAHNVSKKQFQTILKNLCKEDHSKYDCFVLFLMSHGLRNGKICCSDGETVDFEEEIGIFSNLRCKALQGKPKLFFVQACRGSEDDVLAVEPPKKRYKSTKMNEPDNEDPPASTAHSNEQILQRPHKYAHYLISYSTFKNFRSYRRGSSGSLYVRAFVEMFRKSYKTKALYDILHDVSVNMGEEKLRPRPRGERPINNKVITQLPVFSTTLKKQVYFCDPPP